MAQRGWVLNDVAEEKRDEWGEAIEARTLCEAQDHARALEFGEHHGIVMYACKAQAQSQRGMQRVWIHRDADHADTGTDQNCGHLL